MNLAQAGEIITAVRAHAWIGEGSCSYIDETMTTLEILEEVKDASATTPDQAIAHLLYLEKIWRERDNFPPLPERLCIVCGAGPLMEGYYMGEDRNPHYRCNAHPIAGWPEQFAQDGENYWTTWEEED